MYLVLYYGDIEDGYKKSIRNRYGGWDTQQNEWKAERRCFNTLNEALAAIGEDFNYETLKDGTYHRNAPDPEDDRIVVWNLNPGEVMKPAWHFSGWHWSFDMDCGLEQGTLPGDNKSLYEIAMEDM